MAQCVFCEATTGLNTQISVSLEDGKKVACDICDTHAEDATPKTVKAAYLDKQGKAEALIAQLKAMGINVAVAEQRPSGLIVATPPPAPPRPKAQPVVEAADPLDLEGDDVVDTTVLDAKSSKGMQSRGGQANFGGGAVNVAGYASIDPASAAANNLPADQRPLLHKARQGKAKLTVVEGRDGQPLVIPEKRVDGMGTTRLRISKKEDDHRLQSRFKKMAKDTIDSDRTPNFANEGYQNTQVTCPMCRGDQEIVHLNKKIACPKCNGAGTISTY